MALGGRRANLFEVGGELIEEVVDDVGTEDTHTHGLCQLACFLIHGHIEGQNAGKLAIALLLRHIVRNPQQRIFNQSVNEIPNAAAIAEISSQMTCMGSRDESRVSATCLDMKHSWVPLLHTVYCTHRLGAQILQCS